MGLNVCNVSVDYSTRTGVFNVISHITFHVAPGEIVYLIGRNGCGKSTLLKAILGELLFRGDVYWQEESTKVHPKGLISWYPQDIELITPLETTVYELFLAKGLSRDELQGDLRDLGICKPSSIKPIFFKQLSELSGGQRQLVMWSAAISGPTKVLLIDEGLKGLDPFVGHEIWTDILSVAQNRQVSVIIVTHDFDFIARNPHRTIVIQDGTVSSILEAQNVTLEVLNKSIGFRQS